MKIISLIIIILGLNSIQILAQEFEFQLKFTDAQLNRDSLILGYDKNATFGLDEVFDEENIFALEQNQDLEVRLVELPEFGNYSEIEVQFKRQIVAKNCEGSFPNALAIMIRTEHWPVKAEWDASLFQDSCNLGSIFTSIPPGGWWDVGSPSDLGKTVLPESNQVTFTSNASYGNSGKLNENYAFKDSSRREVSVYWFAFGKSGLGASVEDYSAQESLDIIPNPVATVFEIKGVERSSIQNLLLLSLDGQVLKKLDLDALDISDLPPAVYILSVKQRDGFVLNKRLLKR